MKVTLTHSEGRLEGLAAALTRRGFAVARAPLIATHPRLDTATRTAAEALLTLPWLLFTSRSAVEAWLELDLPHPTPNGAPRVGALGGKTAAALAAVGIDVRLIAESPDAEGLARSFLRRRDAAGPVGLPQGSRARPELRAALERAGVRCRPVVLYDTDELPWQQGAPLPDVVVLASPSAVQALPENVARRALLITLGPSSSRAVRTRGHVPHQAAAPAVEAVVEIVTRLALPGSGAAPPTPEEQR